MTLGHRNPEPAAFPDRRCETCASSENVIVTWGGHQLCGHCASELAQWIDYEAITEQWIKLKSSGSSG